LGPITKSMTFGALTQGKDGAFHICYNVLEKWSPVEEKNEAYMFWTGTGPKDAPNLYDFHLHHNLMLDCKLGSGTPVEFKGCLTKAYNNVLERFSGNSFKMRNGEDCQFIDNLHIDMPNSHIELHGEHHILLNNQWLNETKGENGGKIMCMAGNRHWDYEIAKDQIQYGEGNNAYASGYCQIGGNHCRVYAKWMFEKAVNQIYKATGHNLGTTSGASMNREVDLSGPFDKIVRNQVAGADYNKTLVRYERAKWGMRYTP